MPRGIANKRHTGEFKRRVVEIMLEDRLSYDETEWLFDIPDRHTVPSWERIYLAWRRSWGVVCRAERSQESQQTEEAQARGWERFDSRSTKAESGEYLPKKLRALVLEEERQSKRRKGSGNWGMNLRSRCCWRALGLHDGLIPTSNIAMMRISTARSRNRSLTYSMRITEAMDTEG